MSEEMTAPKVEQYIETLGDVNYRDISNRFFYDDKSYADIHKLFELLKKIKPTSSDYIWRLWLPVKRGKLEDFADPNDQDDLEYYGAENREELERVWKTFYPHEIMWYRFSAIDDAKIDDRRIYLGDKQIITVNEGKTEKAQVKEISELTGWLLATVNGVIAELKAGTYNARVEKELPLEQRIGDIPRKDYFDLFPDRRERFLNGITKLEIEEFVGYANSQPEDSENMDGHLLSVTANDFFNACAIAYKANDYKDCSRTPIEQYKGNADGRDEGLTELDPDSAEAFEHWLEWSQYGGHPWEIYPGGSVTHIDLEVSRDTQGYFFSLAGSSESRCIETVRIYLALKRSDIPVFLWDAPILVDRLLETDLIGIVPQDVWPYHCEHLYPDDEIHTFMNLPVEQDEAEQMLPFISWQLQDEVKLAQTQSE